MEAACFECDVVVTSEDDLDAIAEAFLAHIRSEHELPYPDQAVRNYAQALQRLTGGTERLDEIGEIEVHRVTPDRIDDWASFFDHDAFVGRPEWAGCYCMEPHTAKEGAPLEDVPRWQDHREGMRQRLSQGDSYGYLAYADGKPAGWVNASRRSDYSLFQKVEGAEPATVIGVSCFVIAPPYRRHGVAGALLDRVVADAASRGAQWIEGYPFNLDLDRPVSFRGSFSLFEQRGFERVQVTDRYTVMRRRV